MPFKTFWFAPASPVNLGVCRALFYGLFFLFYLPWDFSAWGEVSPVFWMPTPLFRLFHLPLLEPPLLAILQFLWKASLLAACVGWGTRLSAWAAFLFGFYLLGLPHCFGKTHHYDAMVVMILGVLALSRCGDAWSVDALRKGGRGDAAAGGDYRWPVQAARVVMAWVFFAAGFAKLQRSGLEWVTSGQMALMLAQARYLTYGAPPATDWGAALARVPWAPQLLSGLSLVLEFFYPLALFFRWARWIFVPGIIGMLLGIRFLMGPTFYPFILCQLFWVPWDRVGAALRSRFGGVSRAAVLFDGDCGICQRTVTFLKRLDLLRNVEFLDVVGEWEEIHRRFPSLNQEACLTEMHVVLLGDGRSFLGFDGYRALAWQIPLGWLTLPFLYLPGVPWAGRRVYRAVAEGRSRAGCPVPHRR